MTCLIHPWFFYKPNGRLQVSYVTKCLWAKDLFLLQLAEASSFVFCGKKVPSYNLGGLILYVTVMDY